jgi:hypothetical protein
MRYELRGVGLVQTDAELSLDPRDRGSGQLTGAQCDLPGLLQKVETAVEIATTDHGEKICVETDE